MPDQLFSIIYRLYRGLTDCSMHFFTAAHASQGWLGLCCLLADIGQATTKACPTYTLAHNVFVYVTGFLRFAFKVALHFAHFLLYVLFFFMAPLRSALKSKKHSVHPFHLCALSGVSCGWHFAHRTAQAVRYVSRCRFSRLTTRYCFSVNGPR